MSNVRRPARLHPSQARMVGSQTARVHGASQRVVPAARPLASGEPPGFACGCIARRSLRPEGRVLFWRCANCGSCSPVGAVRMLKAELGSSGSARCAPPTLLARHGRHQPAARAGECFGASEVRERSASCFAGCGVTSLSCLSQQCRKCSRSVSFQQLTRGRRGKLALMACHQVLLHQPPNRFIERTANGGARSGASAGVVPPLSAAHVER